MSGPDWGAFGFAASLKKPRAPVDPGSSCQPSMNLWCNLGLPSYWRPLFWQLSRGFSEIQAQQRGKPLDHRSVPVLGPEALIAVL